MHTLHTTDAFILGSSPHGESNRVYSLFTETFGFLYAHGQGVRRLESRNRYALMTGGVSRVTLVRGRDVWRITGAERIPGMPRVSGPGRRALALVAAFAPREEALASLFTSLRAAHEASAHLPAADASVVETLMALRVLATLGYVAPPPGALWYESLLSTHTCTPETLGLVVTHRPAIVRLINNALVSANT